LATATTDAPERVPEEVSTAASGVTAASRTGVVGCADPPTALAKMTGVMTAMTEATRMREAVKTPRT
jgi:hypothetical protein